MMMIIRPLLLITQLLAVGPTMPASVSSHDAAVRSRVETATRQFFVQWHDAWSASQGNNPYGLSETTQQADDRTMALHCHWDDMKYGMRKHLIRGRTTAHATCPLFLPPGITPPSDERRSIDNAIDPSLRRPIHEGRARLRELLDSAAVQLPNDIKLTGQRVRFAIDAGDFEGAMRVGRSCTADAAQCGLLRGLILYRSGDITRADSAFVVAADMMAPDRRCEWNDVRLLMDGDVRDRYEHMSCHERAEFETRFWWLTDPMWTEPGNERRAEHFARKVVIGLLEEYGDDGRQNFAPRKGGQAVEESIVRYGWPTQMIWAGPSVDASHTVWLRQHFADAAPPYLVREYSRAGRLHAVPLSHALEDPMAAKPDDWQLTEPADDDNWWPQEHYARDASALVELPVGQLVMLRREKATRVVWAGMLDSTARGISGDTARRVTLLEARAVGNDRPVASFALRGGKDAVVDAPLAPGKILVGVEVAGDSSRAAARTRFSTNVTAPLEALGGGRALSQALLFEPPSDDLPKIGAEQAVARMFATTTLAGISRVGVYWESYGFNPTDTADLSLRVVRQDRPNVFLRALHVLHIGSESIDSVTIKWREAPGNSRAIQSLEGQTNVQMRSVILETSSLRRGHYKLTLAVSKPGDIAVASESLFELQEKAEPKR
jgi:hypothetical protein